MCIYWERKGEKILVRANKVTDINTDPQRMCLSSWEANKRQSQAQQRHIKHCVMPVCWCSCVVGWDGVPLALKGTGNRITDQATPLPAARIHSIYAPFEDGIRRRCACSPTSLQKRGGAAGTVLTLLTEGVSCRSVPLV